MKQNQGSQNEQHIARIDDELPLPYVETPFLRSLFVGAAAGVNVWMKMETVQPTGSFKARGLGSLVREEVLANPGSHLHFICPSGGNAGYATAYAAKLFRQKCTVCVPETTHPDMVNRIRTAGARVVMHGTSIGESESFIHKSLIPEAEARGEHTVFAHPYDSPIVWEGNASLGHEIVAQSDARKMKPAAIVCAVGGGGLFNGLAQALIEAKWTDVRLVVVETSGHALLHAAIKGQPTQIGHTIASSLATPSITKKSIEYARGGFPTHSIVVTDGDAARACSMFAADHHMLVEPACGAALAAVYNGTVKRELGLQPQDDIVVVVCGGSNVSYPRISEWSRL